MNILFMIATAAAAIGQLSPNADDRAKNTLYIQQQLANGNTALYIPPGQYYVDRLTIVPHHTKIYGASRELSKISMFGNMGDPVFVTGVELPANIQIDDLHRVPLIRYLDSSVANRYGYSTLNDTHIGQMFGPFSNGTYGLSKFTMNWAIAGTYHTGTYFGCKDKTGAAPWHLGTTVFNGNSWVLELQSDGAGSGRYFNVIFPVSTDGGTHEYTVTMDIPNKICNVWIDQVPTPTVPINWPMNATALATPDYPTPFMMGCCGLSMNEYSSSLFESDGDFTRTFLGLQIFNDILYKTDPTTNRQIRIDGRPNVAVNRYFGIGDPNNVGFLGFEQPGTIGVTNNRFMNIWGNRALRTTGFIIGKEANSNGTNKIGNEFRDLTIEGGPKYGSAINSGFSIDLTCTDLYLRGGAYGFATWNWGSNYVNRFQRVSFQGNNSAFYCFFGMSELDNCQTGFLGRDTFLIRWGSFSGKGITVNGYGACRSVVMSHGALTSFENMSVDIEDAQSPSDAEFIGIANAEALRNSGWLKIRNLNNGNLNNKRPLVRLDALNSVVRAEFAMEGLADYGEHPAVIQCDSDLWRGILNHANPYVSTANIMGKFPNAISISVPPSSPATAVGAK